MILPKIISYCKSSGTSRLPRERSKPSKTLSKRAIKKSEQKNNRHFDWHRCHKGFDIQCNRRIGGNERIVGCNNNKHNRAIWVNKCSTISWREKKKNTQMRARLTKKIRGISTSCLCYLGTSRAMWCSVCKLWSREECTDGSTNSVCWKLQIWWNWNT
jgi:hypothetical protein